MSLQLLVILVPVVFGMLGFAYDLGRLYLIRGELTDAANAMALAGAQQLIGTTASLDNATAASQLTLDDSTGHSNKYNFGSLVVGQGSSLLASEVQDPQFFTTAAAATGTDTTSVDQADGTTARHIQVNVTADAPLLFWSFLSVGQSRKTSIAARSVAGISSPVCTACGIQNIAIAAISTDDTTDFGYTVGTQYTLAFSCNPLPGQANETPFSGTTLARYVLIDRDKASSLDGPQNLYKIGADGLIASTSRTQSCLTVGDSVTIWQDPDTEAYLTPQACGNIQAPPGVIEMLCGMNTRFDTAIPDLCSTNVAETDTLAANYTPDTDVATYDDYTQYTGNVRRILTVAIVDTLAATSDATMTILGFRQFLINPNADGLIPYNDQWGRVPVLYIGSVVPLRQGYVGDRFQTGCTGITGPGKVVLHQ